MFRNYLYSFLLLFGLATCPLHAFNDFNQTDLKNFAKSFQFDKAQVSQMIDLLQRTGQITAEQARQAKQELESYSDDDINALREQAVQRIEGASSVNEVLPESMMNQGRSSGILPSLDSGEASGRDDDIDYQEILRSLNP